MLRANIWIIIFLCIYSFNITATNSRIYPINSPYTQDQVKQNIIFRNFSEPPKHLDPVRAYSADEYEFIAQIYEPPYQYHYLLRPYQLEPLSANGTIQSEYFDQNYNKLSNDAEIKDIKYTVYTIKIKSDIYYQPHPAFVKNYNDNYRYHNLDEELVSNVSVITDFDIDINQKNKVNTRELTANDFIYQIKRLADPKNQSPIFSLMAEYIVGLDKLNMQLFELAKQQNNPSQNIFIDLNKYDIDGLRLIDKYTYQIKINGKYPQFIFWLAMPFFAPIPWEADKFYSQTILKQQNISLDTYPVGTGPYMLTINNPNRNMVLDKNPNYKHGFYPTQGMPEDQEIGLLRYSGRQLPLIDKAVYHLEKESIPIWNKFLQGYYDYAGISSDNFDQAIEIVNSKLELSEEMKEKEISLVKTVEPSLFYWAFNMLDDTVGGYSDEQRKLRHALAIAFDVEEYINIFRNGRGVIAHGPIPMGIMTKQQEQQFNRYIYEDKQHKKNIVYAKQLLEEAGYKNGINPKTGDPLVINYDAVGSGNPSEGAMFNWMREQFKKLNVKLNVRVTQYNRFRDKVSSGQTQMFMWGWNADYPDPENFLFLFLCSQATVKYNGENSANYCNSEYDELFNKMQATNNEQLKQQYIDDMIGILRHDGPWIFGLYNEAFILKHGWLDPSKPLAVGNNNLKYLSLDSKKRLHQQKAWNKPKFWPVILIILCFAMLILPVAMGYYKKIHRPRLRID